MEREAFQDWLKRGVVWSSLWKKGGGGEADDVSMFLLSLFGGCSVRRETVSNSEGWCELLWGRGGENL